MSKKKKPKVEVAEAAPSAADVCKWLTLFGQDVAIGGPTGGTLARLRDGWEVMDVSEAWAKPDDREEQYKKRRIKIRDNLVDIYEPLEGSLPDTWLPSSDMMANALATLNDSQLSNIQTAYLMRNARSDQGSAVADYQTGKLRYFWRGSPHPQSDIDWAIQHESGHGLTLNGTWRDDPSHRQAWIDAIAEDGRSISSYGDMNEAEDFAEFTLLYAMVVGTPCEDCARELFPARFYLMDPYFPEGLVIRIPEEYPY